MKKIFLSVPMKCRTDEAIDDTIEKMMGIIKMYYPNEEIEFCHNHNTLVTKELEQIKKNIPNLIKNDAVWYLGEAIKVLAGCDMLFEIAGGQYYPIYSNGCAMEKSTALRYGIPVRTLPNFDGFLTPDIKRPKIEYYNRARVDRNCDDKNVDTDADGIPVYNGEE